VSDTALGVNHGIVVNGEMTGNAHLSRKKDSFPQNGRSGESCLGADDVVFADHAGVTDLHQAIDLGAAADARLADRGAIDRGEGLNLDVVFDDGDAALDDFLVGAVRAFGKAEAIAPNHDAVLERYAMADATEFANDRMRVRQKIVADMRVVIDHHVRMQNGVFPDHHVFANHGEGADGGVLADASRIGDRCRGMDTGSGPRRLVEEGQRPGEIEIGVAGDELGHAQRRNGLGQQDRAGAGIFHFMGILRVGQKCELTGAGLLHSSDARDGYGAIADKAAAEARREFRQKNRDSLHVS